MNIGIRLHDTAEGTLRERLSFAEKQGFSCAHLALSKVSRDFSMQEAPKLLTTELAEQVKADFAAQHMTCAVLGCYLSLADTDEQNVRRTQEIYRAHLRFSRMMGAAVVGTETPPAKGLSFPPDVSSSEEAFQLFLKCARPVVRWAEEEDAILAVEPVFCHIVSTPERAERMLEAFRSDHIRIILDAVNLLSPGTAPCADQVVEEAIRRLGDRVSVLHLKDYAPVKEGDDRLTSIACGNGEMKYERLLAFGKKNSLPMTLEDTRPENAEQARIFLENIGRTC